MSLLKTPTEPSIETSSSFLEYCTALNSIQAGYCDERHEWVLNELLDLCRHGATNAELLNHIAPYNTVYPGRVVTIVRTLVRGEILKAADAEITRAQQTEAVASSAVPNSATLTKAVQCAIEMAVESPSRSEFYQELRNLNVSQPFAASLAGLTVIRRQFRARSAGHLALSILLAIVGLAMFVTSADLRLPAIMCIVCILRYLFGNLLRVFQSLSIPRPTFELEQPLQIAVKS